MITKYTVLYFFFVCLAVYYQNIINALDRITLIFINVIIWYGNAFFYYFLDRVYSDEPELFDKFGIEKIQDSREKLTFWTMFPISNLNLITNHTLVLLLSLNFDKYLLFTNASFLTICFELISYSVIYEIVFYVLHRIMHIPSIYRHLHKLHHETFGTVAISCFYMTFPDMILEIFIPVVAGPILMSMFLKCHQVSIFIYSTLAVVNTFMEHSGYGVKTHYYHHSKFVYNYGLNLSDKLMKTNYDPDSFKKIK